MVPLWNKIETGEMKTQKYLRYIVLIAGAFIAGIMTYHAFMGRPQNIKRLIRESDQKSSILLDSAILQEQIYLLEKDSLSSMFMLFEMQESPLTSFYMIECLRRNHILDEDAYRKARSKMFMYCCL